MKYIIFTLLLVVISSCKSTEKTSTTNLPFTITNATYQNWYGGQEGVHGITIRINGIDFDKNTSYQNIYFQNNKAPLITNFKGLKLFLEANINTSTRKENLVIHGNVQKEYGNKAPVKKEHPMLKKGEAILYFTKNNQKLSSKIELNRKETIYYP